MCKFVIVYLYLYSFVVLGIELGPVLEILDGQIQGRVEKNSNGKTFHAFEGVPFAVPPIGEERFTISRKLDTCWSGVLKADDNSHKCVQSILLKDYSDFPGNPSFHIIGSEDCLYLNIYSPANLGKGENNELPVLVWIHEGAFQYKSKQLYKPNFFMDFDIVVVTINYRLGPLGFLSTHDGVIPSNLGLKDQRQAIRWVSQNIKYFGGDPTKVTVAGQSAGSIGISYLLLDEKCQGLFRGAILESGSALCPHDFQSDPKTQAYHLGRLINPDFKNNSIDLLKTLKQMSINELMEYAYSPYFRLNNKNDVWQINILNNVWLPVVENSKDEDIVIPMPMHQAFLDGQFIKIPMIAGFTSDEAVGVPEYEESFKDAREANDNPGFLIDPNLNIKNKHEAGEKLKAVYTEDFTTNLNAVVKFFSDYYYITPILRQADLIRSHVPVFLYQFSYQHSTKLQTDLPGAEKVGHSSELRYIFRDNEFPNEQDRLTHERMMKMWTNFIKFQHPTPDAHDDTLIKWPKTTHNLEYLNINRTLSILNHPRRYEAWRQILSEYIDKPYWIY
ncbi:cocaine esterase-like isoform X1 [Diorhabda sublineata]|uniref:cocaine esterase-like isoform X1 n=1 Tax=Diorhabda sublineata TaxID=1163346 RepID=UPI0024E1768F|nr:cocaine esterase-like isoform X1 [Diorhabda sublineata]